MPAASAICLVVVAPKPLRANSGKAASTIALRRASLSSRTVAMAGSVSGPSPRVKRAGSARLDGPVAVTVLRHAALQRHVRMHAEPAAVLLAHQDQGGAAGPVEARAVALEAGAGPGRDHGRHRAVGTDQQLGVGEIEGEALGARPDIVPLGV